MIFGQTSKKLEETPQSFQRLLEAEKIGGTEEWPVDKIAEKRWDYWNYDFVKAREWAGGFQDPLFFGTDWKRLAQLDPDKFATLVYEPKKGARGYQMGSLSEWRIVGGDALELVEVVNHYNTGDIEAITGWKK
jgi:hypothetical protein